MRSSVDILLPNSGVRAKLASRLRHQLHQPDSALVRHRSFRESGFGRDYALYERGINLMLARRGRNNLTQCEFGSWDVKPREYWTQNLGLQHFQNTGGNYARGKQEKETQQFQ